jgi:hypothetical protein
VEVCFVREIQNESLNSLAPRAPGKEFQNIQVLHSLFFLVVDECLIDDSTWVIKNQNGVAAAAPR